MHREPSVSTLRSHLDNSRTTFRRLPKTLRVEYRNSTPLFASLPERGNESIKYLISSSGNRNHNLSHLHSHIYAPAPRLFNLTLFDKLWDNKWCKKNQLHAVSRARQGRQRERRNGNINFSKYFISSNGDRIQPVGSTVTPRAAAPRLSGAKLH